MIKPLKSIRFYLAITIFLNHLFFLKNTEAGDKIFERVFHNGNYGVVFFLVLSGFGMALGYSDKFTELNRQNYGIFILNRIKKIYPLYIATMLMVFFIQVLQHQVAFDFLGVLRIFLCIIMCQTLIPAWYDSFNGAAWYISCIFILYLFTPILLHFLDDLKKNLKKLVILGGGGTFYTSLCWS